MEKALIDFASMLRKAGVKVSQAEVVDSLGILLHLKLEERSVFKDALRSTLIKRAHDIPLFDSLFEFHFSRGPIIGGDAGVSELSGLAEPATSQYEPSEEDQSDLSPVIEMIVTGRLGPLTRFLLEQSRELALKRMAVPPLRGKFFVQQLRRSIALDQAKIDAEDLLERLNDQDKGEGKAEVLRTRVRHVLERLEAELASLVQNEVAKKRFLYLQRIDAEELADRNLFNFTEEEFQAMRPVVDRLARRLKDRLSLRFKHADRGRLDIKATLRRNIGLGGPLPEICLRNKKRSRPQVIALCDVSRSVRDFSRFMLLFLYTLKEVIAKIRSFIFIGNLAEVTLLFQQRDLNEAVSVAAQGYGLTSRFRTDYGWSLAQFVDQHISAVTSKTTVLIMGDARNNNYEPRVEALEALAGRARKIIWLNPEPQSFWNMGDSVINLYEPYCAKVSECGNLKQLSAIIEEQLIPG
jgi:uncharacterized protein with von Willebrand factor type A (vWA) domain